MYLDNILLKENLEEKTTYNPNIIHFRSKKSSFSIIQLYKIFVKSKTESNLDTIFRSIFLSSISLLSSLSFSNTLVIEHNNVINLKDEVLCEITQITKKVLYAKNIVKSVDRMKMSIAKVVSDLHSGYSKILYPFVTLSIVVFSIIVCIVSILFIKNITAFLEPLKKVLQDIFSNTYYSKIYQINSKWHLVKFLIYFLFKYSVSFVKSLPSFLVDTFKELLYDIKQLPSKFRGLLSSEKTKSSQKEDSFEKDVNESFIVYEQFNVVNVINNLGKKIKEVLYAGYALIRNYSASLKRVFDTLMPVGAFNKGSAVIERMSQLEKQIKEEGGGDEKE